MPLSLDERNEDNNKPENEMYKNKKSTNEMRPCERKEKNRRNVIYHF